MELDAQFEPNGGGGGGTSNYNQLANKPSINNVTLSGNKSAADLGLAAAAALAPEYSSSSTYAVGDLVLKDGQLYECNTAISTAEAWNSSHWTSKTVADEFSDLKEDINDKIDSPSSPSSGDFLVYNGSAWVAQSLSTWQGGSY